jgi:hypothetical protein
MGGLNGNGVLAGSTAGKVALGRLVAGLGAEPEHPQILLLDFSDVEVATGSFLRESVLALCKLLRSGKSNLYPVASNVNDNVTDEFSLVLDSRGEAMFACDSDIDGRPAKWRILGSLDDRQRFTLNLVKDMGEADAARMLRASQGVELVGQTAWNNRLSSLANLGLLVETSSGKSKTYRSVMEIVGGS